MSRLLVAGQVEAKKSRDEFFNTKSKVRREHGQTQNEGAYVFITGRREPELAAAVNQIGRNVTGIQGDVSKMTDLARLFAQIEQEKERLDIIFANAGIAKYAALGATTEELYQSTFDINVKGVLFTVQKALPLLPDGASIILNSSIVGSKGLAMNSVYSASKAALRSFARTWSTDLKDRHIRVNAISPRFDRHAGTEQFVRLGHGRRGAQKNDSETDTAWQARDLGRDCQGGGVFGF